MDNLIPGPIAQPEQVKVLGQGGGEFHVWKDETGRHSKYLHYSEDGETFYDGEEIVTAGRGTYGYQGQIRASGVHSGEIDLKMTMQLTGMRGCEVHGQGFAVWDGDRLEMNQ